MAEKTLERPKRSRADRMMQEAEQRRNSQTTFANDNTRNTAVQVRAQRAAQNFKDKRQQEEVRKEVKKKSDRNKFVQSVNNVYSKINNANLQATLDPLRERLDEMRDHIMLYNEDEWYDIMDQIYLISPEAYQQEVAINSASRNKNVDYSRLRYNIRHASPEQVNAIITGEPIAGPDRNGSNLIELTPEMEKLQQEEKQRREWAIRQNRLNASNFLNPFPIMSDEQAARNPELVDFQSRQLLKNNALVVTAPVAGVAGRGLSLLGYTGPATSVLGNGITQTLSTYTPPSQVIGSVREGATGDGNFLDDASNALIEGNSGIFDLKFAEDHPIVSLVGNMATDAAGISLASNPKATMAGVKAIPNAAQQLRDNMRDIRNRTFRNIEISRALNEAADNWNGTVTDNYFDDPYSWYRILSQPEVESLGETGFNVTSTDAHYIPTVSNEWRIGKIKHNSFPGTGESEGYWHGQKRGKLLLQKTGSAHGNRTQASAMKPWGGSVATGRQFTTNILEGDMGPQVPVGLKTGDIFRDRSTFHFVPIEEVQKGDRVGFRTGEMPMGGLRSFSRNPDGTWQYNGMVSPPHSLYFDPDLGLVTPRQEFMSNFLQHESTTNPTFNLGRTFLVTNPEEQTGYRGNIFVPARDFRFGSKHKDIVSSPTRVFRGDYGDAGGGFYNGKNGGIKDGILYPGVRGTNGETPYTWWQQGYLYPLFDGDYPYPTRIFFGEKKNIPGLHPVTESTDPNIKPTLYSNFEKEKFGLDADKELITSEPVPTSALTQYNIDPFTAELDGYNPMYVREGYPTMKRYKAPYIEEVELDPIGRRVEIDPDDIHHHGIHTPLERAKLGNITYWHKKGGKLK